MQFFVPRLKLHLLQDGFFNSENLYSLLRNGTRHLDKDQTAYLVPQHPRVGKSQAYAQTLEYKSALQ